MNIVLGIFDTYMRKIARREGNCAYPFDELIPDVWERFSDILNIVLFAARKSDKIIFVIDGLLPNITGTEDSVTCKELIRLLQCPFIPISKIEFWDNEQIVAADYVQNKLNLSKELFE